MLGIMQVHFKTCAVDPYKKGPLRIIMEVDKSGDYLNLRAQEYLRLAQTALTLDQKNYYMNLAMSLVVLSAFEYNDK